jgi:hypothetical protein
VQVGDQIISVFDEILALSRLYALQQFNNFLLDCLTFEFCPFIES